MDDLPLHWQNSCRIKRKEFLLAAAVYDVNGVRRVFTRKAIGEIDYDVTSSVVPKTLLMRFARLIP